VTANFPPRDVAAGPLGNGRHAVRRPGRRRGRWAAATRRSAERGCDRCSCLPRRRSPHPGRTGVRCPPGPRCPVHPTRGPNLGRRRVPVTEPISTSGKKPTTPGQSGRDPSVARVPCQIRLQAQRVISRSHHWVFHRGPASLLFIGFSFQCWSALVAPKRGTVRKCWVS